MQKSLDERNYHRNQRTFQGMQRPGQRDRHQEHKVFRGDCGGNKRAIKSHSLKMRREEVLASQKVGDKTSDNPKDNTYLSYMTLPNSRVWMRVRARMTKGVKMNLKSSHLNDLSCSFCKGPMEESQEHLEEDCPCDERGGPLFKKKVCKWKIKQKQQIYDMQ